MRLGIALHCQIPRWPLSSAFLCSLGGVPRDGCVLTGLLHSVAAGGKLMRPRLRASVTPCDDTSAPALNGSRRSARCGEVTKKSCTTLTLTLTPTNKHCSAAAMFWVLLHWLNLYHWFFFSGLFKTCRGNKPNEPDISQRAQTSPKQLIDPHMVHRQW